jgi:hypothetical protein
VLLRPWREADVPGVVLAFRDPVIHRFSWRLDPCTDADGLDWLARQYEARLRSPGGPSPNWDWPGWS